MNCGGARRLFGAYWDDEITLAERDWLEAHFSVCTSCRGEYEQFARTIELMSTLPRVAPQPELAERALARARRAVAAPDRLPVTTPRWIPITATAALLTIAATMTLQWIGVGPPARGVDGTGSSGTARVEPARIDSRSQLTAVGSEATNGQAGVADTLFDHSADVEFILDPVVVRKGRAHTVLHVNPAVQGEKAVITF